MNLFNCCTLRGRIPSTLRWVFFYESRSQSRTAGADLTLFCAFNKSSLKYALTLWPKQRKRLMRKDTRWACSET